MMFEGFKREPATSSKSGTLRVPLFDARHDWRARWLGHEGKPSSVAQVGLSNLSLYGAMKAQRMELWLQEMAVSGHVGDQCSLFIED